MARVSHEGGAGYVERLCGAEIAALCHNRSHILFGDSPAEAPWPENPAPVKGVVTVWVRTGCCPGGGRLIVMTTRKKKVTRGAAAAARSGVGDVWDKLEKIFEQRVTKVLNSLQIPTHAGESPKKYCCTVS